MRPNIVRGKDKKRGTDPGVGRTRDVPNPNQKDQPRPPQWKMEGKEPQYPVAPRNLKRERRVRREDVKESTIRVEISRKQAPPMT
jgi:flagella basal body P-ring formation protein FlgA